MLLLVACRAHAGCPFAHAEFVLRDLKSTRARPRGARLRFRVAVVAESLQFPKFDKCAVERLAARRTRTRCTRREAVDVKYHCACEWVDCEPANHRRFCTRDSAALCVAPRIELYSALDLTLTRLVLCAHRVIQEDLVITIAQVNTCCSSRDAK